MPNQPAHTMQCMEVWGSNRRVSTQVSMAGIDAWVYSRPYAPIGEAAADSGGDLHYLSSCASGRITRAIVADVSGHGEVVAEAARSLRRLMGRFTNYVDQDRLVDAVNRRFNQLHDEAASFAGLFATAIIATYFSPTDELAFCNAGHPPPLWLDSTTGRWSAVELPDESDSRERPSNLPLGVLEETAFRQRTLRLSPADLVVVYTDPLLEIRGPDGRYLGQSGLLNMVAAIPTHDPAAFIADLLAALSAFAGLPPDQRLDPELGDDTTIMVLRRNNDKPRASFAKAIAAAWTITRQSLAASLRLPDKYVALPPMSKATVLGAMLPGYYARRAKRRDADLAANDSPPHPSVR